MGWVVQEKHETILKIVENMVASVPKLFCFLLSLKCGSCHPLSQNDYEVVIAANSWSRPLRQVRKDTWRLRLIISSSNAQVYSFLYLSLENIYEGRALPSPGVTLPAAGIIHFGWPLFSYKHLKLSLLQQKMASFNPAIIYWIPYLFKVAFFREWGKGKRRNMTYCQFSLEPYL